MSTLKISDYFRFYGRILTGKPAVRDFENSSEKNKAIATVIGTILASLIGWALVFYAWYMSVGPFQSETDTFWVVPSVGAVFALYNLYLAAHQLGKKPTQQPVQVEGIDEGSLPKQAAPIPTTSSLEQPNLAKAQFLERSFVAPTKWNIFLSRFNPVSALAIIVAVVAFVAFAIQLTPYVPLVLGVGASIVAWYWFDRTWVKVTVSIVALSLAVVATLAITGLLGRNFVADFVNNVSAQQDTQVVEAPSIDADAQINASNEVFSDITPEMAFKSGSLELQDVVQGKLIVGIDTINAAKELVENEAQVTSVELLLNGDEDSETLGMQDLYDISNAWLLTGHVNASGEDISPGYLKRVDEMLNAGLLSATDASSLKTAANTLVTDVLFNITQMLLSMQVGEDLTQRPNFAQALVYEANAVSGISLLNQQLILLGVDAQVPTVFGFVNAVEASYDKKIASLATPTALPTVQPTFAPAIQQPVYQVPVVPQPTLVPTVPPLPQPTADPNRGDAPDVPAW